MPKKKKTQLKAIPRGFAVTSIPKKVLPEPPPSQHDSDANGESASSEVPHTAQTHEAAEDKALGLQSAEEISLQKLVDGLQERTEKEIVRTVKVRGCAPDFRRRLAHSIRLFRLSKRKDDFLVLFRC